MGSGASKDTVQPNTTEHIENVKRFESRNLNQKPTTLRVGDNRRQKVPSEDRKVQLVQDISADIHGLQQILGGNPGYGFESKGKIVRIFTSSTFTDTFHERNHLMENVYPKLKTFCQERGYEFQVVDMRWGVREEAENDHLSVELCLKEIKECQKLSTGPNFISFLSHKYGYRPFPRLITEEQFDLITQDVSEDENQLLQDWFLFDENQLTAVYTLQPISSHFPDFLHEDPARRKEAKDQWSTVYEKLSKLLVRGAKKYLKGKEQLNFLISVTEREVQSGILDTKDTQKHCLWFKRVFDDIGHVTAGRELSRYTECLGDADTLRESKRLMQELREAKIPKKLADSKIMQYHINWKEKDVKLIFVFNEGVKPEDPQHAKYLEQLCSDFEREMTAMIELGLQKRPLADAQDMVVGEIMEHSAFRHARCGGFSGRIDLLEVIQSYVKGSSVTPLIIVGEAGSGKSSLVAKAASESWDWFHGKISIVYRDMLRARYCSIPIVLSVLCGTCHTVTEQKIFLGTTSLSSSVRPLLSCINKQLSRLYAVSLPEKDSDSQDMKALMEEFTSLLNQVPTSKPLLLFLDAMDNLDTADGGRQLEWLPRELPPNVRLVLSMIPEEKYGVYQRCRTIVPAHNCYLPVPELTSLVVEEVLDKWLNMTKRRLTELQHYVILEGFRRCSLPLYLKLAFEESLRWHSYDPQQETRLYASVPAMINAFFTRVEKQHGKILVSFALSFFTASPSGLSEAEMEDLLSLCDTVLNDVYQYWVPPVRRLPPLLWVRIKSELDSYLGKREEGGVQMICWLYASFHSVAYDRYLANQTSRQICHSIIANYYVGIWSDKAKPYKNKAGQTQQALRYVARQPLMFENGSYNRRKLSQLPYHLVRSGKVDAFKEEVLCNYEFLRAKITALGIRAVLHDIKEAQIKFPKDPEISLLLECLQLSQDTITANPQELAGQLIGRMHMNLAANDVIIRKARQMMLSGELESASVAMVTTLVDMLEELVDYQNERYKSLVKLLCAARRSSVPVLVPHTACLVKPGGQLLHKLSEHLDKVNDLDITNDGQTAATGSDDNTIKLWDVESGELRLSCQVHFDVAYIKFYPNDKRLVASTVMSYIYVIDVAMGTVVHTIENLQENEFSTLPVAVVETDPDQSVIVALRSGSVDLLDGDTGRLVKSCADGLSTHGPKKWVERKHVTSLDGIAVYASFAGSDVHLLEVGQAAAGKVQPEKCPVFPMDPAWDGEQQPIISAIAVVPASKFCVVCNGITQQLFVFDLTNRRVVNVISGHRNDVITQMFFSPAEGALYCASRRAVAVFNVKEGGRQTLFSHPCQVRKVVSRDGRYVITLGEDNVLRIWDQKMLPFAPDVSAYSGKVTVRSRASMDMFSSLLDMFSEDFEEAIDDVRSLLTTENVNNYWTKPQGPALKQTGTIKTLFLKSQNVDYLTVIQNTQDPKEGAASLWWTLCVTIWNLPKMHCVRRFFPPPSSMLVHLSGHASESLLWFTDLGREGSPLYKMAAEEGGFSPVMMSEDLPKVARGSLMAAIPDTHFVVAEDTKGELVLFDTDKDTIHATLKRKSTHNAPAGQANYTMLEVSPAAQWLLAVDSGLHMAIWRMEDASLVAEVRLADHLPGLSGDASPPSLTFIPGTRFLVVTSSPAAFATAPPAVKMLDSAKTFDLNTGRCCGPLKQASGESKGHVAACILRREGDRILSLVAADQKGSGYVTKEVNLGRNADRVVTSSDGTRCVTWSSGSQEQTIKYWRISTDVMELLGAFTPDEEVDEVCLADSGQSVVISTTAGLVRLDLTGRVGGTGVPDPSQGSPEARARGRQGPPLHWLQGTDLDVQLVTD